MQKYSSASGGYGREFGRSCRKAQEDSERAETESEAGTEYVETLAGVPTGEIYSETLMDYDFLLGHFYYSGSDNIGK